MHCYLSSLILSILLCAAPTAAQTPYCTGEHQWWDGQSCNACTRAACGIGMYRQECTSSSTQNARCIPCQSPPANAYHVTGGYPHTSDNCMWVCMDGYYKLADGSGCGKCSVETCDAPLVRSVCRAGSSSDSSCVCPEHNYMLSSTDGTPTQQCAPCAVTSCEVPSMLIKCNGGTYKDVSRCIQSGRPGPGKNRPV
jgi:hypothetical protein